MIALVTQAEEGHTRENGRQTTRNVGPDERPLFRRNRRGVHGQASLDEAVNGMYDELMGAVAKALAGQG